ncbi:MAG: rRNA maturation RNase YbeY [Parcubacteria group bacterium QH_9_35_7]|nr:MAG: rRNA maturation RNase YbeY [Parcubacteria group bacterium QH_9_35_7]
MECNVFSQIEKEILANEEVEKVVTEVLTQIDEEGAVSVHKIGDKKMRELNRISVPQIKKQAKEQEVPPKEEFKRVLIHGVLHLLGYDHQQPEESEEMFSLQKKLLKQVT